MVDGRVRTITYKLYPGNLVGALISHFWNYTGTSFLFPMPLHSPPHPTPLSSPHLSSQPFHLRDGSKLQRASGRLEHRWVQDKNKVERKETDSRLCPGPFCCGCVGALFRSLCLAKVLTTIHLKRRGRRRKRREDD